MWFFIRFSYQFQVQETPKIYSPIVINDSCELSFNNEFSKINFAEKEPPSKVGNVST